MAVCGPFFIFFRLKPNRIFLKTLVMKTSRIILVALFATLPIWNGCSKGDDDPDSAYSSLTKYAFEQSDEQFPNPERGFFSHLEIHSNASPSVMPASMLRSERVLNRSLVYNIYYLENFIDAPISDDYLALIEGNMAVLREVGMKCVLRFAYNRSYSELDHPWDATEEVVHQHIAQLRPIFQEYADVILCLEAGFVGTFGEWYYTDNFNYRPRTTEEYAPRRRLMDALLNALPAERQIVVRYPAAKLMMYELTVADSLTEATAHNGSAIARIGAHNDCFVSSSNDVGTYNNNEERQYVYAESRYTIWGGESCAVTAYCDCERALPKVELHHMTYLNINYHQGVLGRWRSQGCFDEISTRMGYRLVIDRAFVTAAPTSGDALRVVIKIRNVGFAAPMNPRGVELVSISSTDPTKKFVTKVDADPRFWFENGEYTVDQQIENLPVGSYDLYLNLPDGSTKLHDNPLFSIRMANKDVWNEQLGMNKICKLSIK